MNAIEFLQGQFLLPRQRMISGNESHQRLRAVRLRNDRRVLGCGVDETDVHLRVYNHPFYGKLGFASKGALNMRVRALKQSQE